MTSVVTKESSPSCPSPSPPIKARTDSFSFPIVVHVRIHILVQIRQSLVSALITLVDRTDMSQFCYNRGCQKNFTLANDPAVDEAACQYHPGLPYFHDAYKIWSCCQKKSHDFTTFLSIPGCTRGPHQPTKPTEPAPARPSEQERTDAPKPAPRQEIPKPQMPSVERPPADAPFTNMKLTVAASLQSALERLSAAPKADANPTETANDEIKLDTPCKHAACGARYTVAEQEQATSCRFHPGVPIFHEGRC